MYSSILKAIALSAMLATSVSAVPSAQSDFEHIQLDNGEGSVTALHSTPNARSEANPLEARQSNINCKGSAFCERLGGSCDDALRKVIAGNTYSTYDGSQNTGTCSGTCGLFFSGGHCEGTGQELIDAYHAIRDKGHCSHCGHYTRDSDGCVIKIDRVTGC